MPTTRIQEPCSILILSFLKINVSVREYFWRKPDDNDVIKLPIKKPSVQITFKEINLSAGLYLHIQKKVTKKICPEKKT